MHLENFVLLSTNICIKNQIYHRHFRCYHEFINVHTFQEYPISKTHDS